MPRGTSFGNSVSPLGMTWKILRMYWVRALLSCKVSAFSQASTRLHAVADIAEKYRCYKELSERVGRVHLLPSSWNERGHTVRELCQNLCSIYSVLDMRSLALFTMPLAYIGSCEKDRYIDIPGRFAVNDTLVSAVLFASVFNLVPYVTWSWPTLFCFALRSFLLVLSCDEFA